MGTSAIRHSKSQGAFMGCKSAQRELVAPSFCTEEICCIRRFTVSRCKGMAGGLDPNVQQSLRARLCCTLFNSVSWHCTQVALSWRSLARPWQLGFVELGGCVERSRIWRERSFVSPAAWHVCLVCFVQSADLRRSSIAQLATQVS